MGTTPTQPIDIATTVADLTPIDWAALEAETTGPAERAALKRLRLLERLVRACADIVLPDGSGPAAATHADADTPPTTWGPFTIHERVGRGTFGDVYRAHDRRLDRIVALKLLRPGREGGVAVESEAIHEGRLLAKVRHPNVVTVHGAERIDDRVGMWMEFIDGRTLAEEVRASGPLAPDAVVAIGLTLCSALAAVHDAGLLHRDLKAQNVMRAADGRILLTDFGAGRALAGQPDDGPAELAGTPLYLAPELLAGQPASIASEVYSFGVLLYYLATGSFPVRGRTLRELRDAHKTGARVSVRAYRHKLPRALMVVIDRATGPDPASRFPSLQALRHALARCRKSAVRTMAWGLVPVTVALLAVVALNVVWSMSPPPVLTAPTAVELPFPVPSVRLLFAKGDRLYFEHDAKTSWMIPGKPGAEVVSEGSLQFWPVAISPVRDEYLGIRRGGSPELWLIPPSGRIGPVGDVRCDYAAWSPEGHRVACLLGEVLSVITIDSASSKVLPTPPHGHIAHPRWSPRGDTLRFQVAITSRGPIAQSIWEVRADGTILRRLLAGWNDSPAEFMGTWVLEGQYFIFGSRVDGRTDLWALREPRGFLDWTRPQPVRLTDGPLSYESPMVTYGDSTILTEAVQRKGEVVRYDLATRRLLPYLNGLSAVDVAFSPDHKSVVYSSWPDRRLWLAASDGTGAHQLVNEPVEMDSPAWSPDNKWIAFTAGLAGGHLKIFLLPADGSGRPTPISNDDREQGAPSWSPDGLQFCFGDVPEQNGKPAGTEVLHIYDVATHAFSVVPGSAGLWTCRWSPNGRYLAAVTVSQRPEDAMRLNVFDRQTGAWTPLPNALHVNTPSWWQDSKFISYETEGDPFSLRRVRLADGKVETLALPPGFVPATQWSGLAPDDSPLLLRDVSVRNVYALKFERR